MSEKINAQKSYDSTVGNTASEVSEMTRRKTFSNREVGFNHPDNPNFIRLTDSGDIEIFAAPGVGIVINGSTRTISLFADNIRFHTKEDGLKWNSMEFNHSATLFSEPTFVGANDLSHNPAFLNMDYYIDNLDQLDKEESQQTVTINGSYDYKVTSQNEVVDIELAENSSISGYFTNQQIAIIQSHWDKYGSAYKNSIGISNEGIENYLNIIKNYISEDKYTLEQALDKITQNIKDNNV
jgi:hypothetical protein